MWEKIKSMAKAVYDYLASRPADTWQHILAGQLISFVLTLFGIWCWVGFIGGVLIGIGKEVWDSRHSELHTPEWRDVLNTAIGALLGVLMAII